MMLEELQRFRAYVSPQIGRAMFEPVERQIRRRRSAETPKPTLTGLEPIRLGYSTLTTTVLQDLEARRVCPATSDDLLLFLGNDPDAVLRRHAPLAALGSVAYVEGFRNVLYATRGRQGAGLLLHRYDSYWDSRFWFLVKPICAEG